MHYQVHENVIPKNIIDEILNFFNTNPNLRENKNYMDKINRPWSYNVVNQLEPILSKFINTEKNLGDNIYKHSYAYFPHTDTDSKYDSINALIPLFVEGNNYQPFVIFDQHCVNQNAKTWMITEDTDTTFEKNQVEKQGIYNDKDVIGCTNQPVDSYLYENFLKNKHRPKSLFHGLTGNAVTYKPGNLILFNSKYIHATGTMQAEYKIGLSLKFEGTLL